MRPVFNRRFERNDPRRYTETNAAFDYKGKPYKSNMQSKVQINGDNDQIQRKKNSNGYTFVKLANAGNSL